MLTREEALQKAFAYLESRGIGWTKLPYSIVFTSKKKIEESEETQRFKARRPEAWKIVESTLRDRWQVSFETGFCSPPIYVVLVDAETGEITIPRML
jgi:hypothetical protein